MNSNKETVDSYLKQLCTGDADSAFHALLEAPDEAVPFIIEGYNRLDPEARATVIKILAERNCPSISLFLETALQDQDDLVWKASVNALVHIGTTESIKILERAKARLSTKANCRMKSWLDEAIEELQRDSSSLNPP